MRKACLVLAIAALVLAGCGSGEESADDTPAPGANTTTAGRGSSGGGGGGGDHAGHGGQGGTETCDPTGTTVAIVASDIAFNTVCIAAPANQQWTLSYDNKDTLTHNIVFLESHTATDVMFRADGFPGPATKTFTVAAQKPGTYAFHCEFHPDRMMGTFVVK